VWLDPTMTSPYKFYQFWLNVGDDEAENLIKRFTLLTQDEITALVEEHAQAPHLRVLQKALAKEVTTTVHSAEEYESAVEASQILFGKGDLETLRGLPESTLLAVFEGVPQIEISKENLANGAQAVDFLSDLTQNQIFESKGEAKKMIQNGGVSINRQKVAKPDETITSDLLQGKYLVVQKGKKNYYLVKAS
jgi:tyrosyl-tRNA synthetase